MKRNRFIQAMNSNIGLSDKENLRKQSVNRFEGMIIELDFWKRWRMLIFILNFLSPFLTSARKICKKQLM